MTALLALSVLAGCSDRGSVGVVPSSTPSAESTPPDAGDPASDANPNRRLASRVVPGEFLVKFKTGTTKDRIDRVLAKAGPSRAGAFKSLPGLRRLKVAATVDLPTIRALLSDREVDYIEPNFLVSASAMPNDPEVPRMWNFNDQDWYEGIDGDINAIEAWDTETGSSDVVIGVVDTGVDYTHEDLAANMFARALECVPNGVDDDSNGFIDDCHGINAIDSSGDPMDDRGHGTHVAGTIGAVGNNGRGIAGVAWNVRIAACKFLSADGYGTTADAITCLDYFADLKDRGVNLVATNHSWGGIDESRALLDAIRAQRDRGILVVAAAGNDREDNDLLPEFPCSYDISNVICVGATGRGNTRTIFSSFGRSRVHLSAPGEFILSTVPGNAYDFKDGTSMAAPHVSGVIALLAAQDSLRDWRALKNLVIAGGDPILSSIEPFTLSNRRVSATGSLSCSNSVVLGRIRPLAFLDFRRGLDEPQVNRRSLGEPIALKALHINCASGNGPVTVAIAPTNEQVALLDDGQGTDEIAGDGVYSAAWTPQVAGTFAIDFVGSDEEPITVEVDAWLKPGFPQQTLAFDFYYDYLTRPSHASTVVANVDTDPELEILASGVTYGPLYMWNHDGTLLPGWPLYYGEPNAYSVGELDGDPSSAEIVVHAGPFANVLALDHRGALLPGWPQHSFLIAPIPLIDIDGDGTDEVIGFPARRADGSLLNPLVQVPAVGNLSGPVSIADLDADEEPDFVSAYDYTIFASNRHGALPPFPATSATLLGPSWQTNIVIGDVDGDGRLELVVGVHEYPDYVGRVLIFSNEGVLERTLTMSSQFASTPALADLDADGIPEIVVMTRSEVYAWKGTGALLPGWPAALGSNLAALAAEPVVGDVNGDGAPDIAVVAQQGVPYRSARLHVFDRHGSQLPGFPIALGTSVGSMPAAIADIDLDGRNDLIVGTNPDWGRRDGVFAFDVRGSGPYGPIEWGQHLGGADHRGYYPLGKNLRDHSYLTVMAHGEGSVASSTGDIDCGADCIERHANGTVVTLTATPVPNGRFNRWLGACRGQGNPCTLSIHSYSSVTAQFDSPLHVAVTGNGTVTSSPVGISCPGDCTETYGAPTLVRLTATAAPGASFEGWSGACGGRGAVCAVNVDRARSVTARFVTERTLTVTKAGTGADIGRIVSEPAGIDCGSVCSAEVAADSKITLRVVPSRDATFAGWNVPCPAYLSPTCEVTMDVARTLTATFVRNPRLTVVRSGGGNGRVRTTLDSALDCGNRCAAVVESDRPVQLVAEPSFDSTFVGWSGECSGTGPYCLVYITDDRTVFAEFAPKSSSDGGGGSGSGGGANPPKKGGGGSTTPPELLLLVTLYVLRRLQRRATARAA